MNNQPKARSSQPPNMPAVRLVALARPRLMFIALSTSLALPALVFLPQAAQAQGTEPPPGIRAGVAQSTGIKVTMTNGFATVQHTDLSLSSVGGQVSWTTYWDGREWRFNPHWESLSVNWSNLIRGKPIALSSQASSNPDRKAV